jgi:cysteine-rich repeat protein
MYTGAFKLTVDVRSAYRISTTAEDCGVTDTALGVYDADTNSVAYNDDSNGFCSEVVVILEAGTYAVIVDSYNEENTVYELVTERLPDLDSGAACLADGVPTGLCPADEFCLEDEVDFDIGACTGRYAVGSDCFLNEECQEGTYCSDLSGSDVCTVNPVEGEECDLFNDFCQGNTYCDGSYLNGYSCVARPVAGEECEVFDDQCLDSTCVQGVSNDICVAPAVAEGDVCATELGCPDGLACGVEIGEVLGQCITPACGDGFVSTDFGEGCDDGNSDDNDGCDSTCTPELSSTVETNDFTVYFYGEISDDDPEWSRPFASCFGNNEGRRYDSFEFTNNSGEDLDIRALASFGAEGDGYLFLYDQAPSAEDWTAGCVEGNDDLDYGLYRGTKSALSVTVASGSTVYFIVSNYGADDRGAYVLEISPLGREVGETCYDNIDNDCGEANLCVEGDPDVFTCVARPIEGEACGEVDCYNSTCQGDVDNGYFCVAYPEVGEGCDPTDDLCVDSQCMGVDDQDATCVAAPAAEGDACDVDYGCFAGSFCSAADGEEIGTCALIVCGDGVQSAGEVCDDGNTDDGDECSADCSVVSMLDPAQVITLSGDLDESDPTWNRFDATCGESSTTSYYEVFPFANETGSELSLDISVNWSLAGYLDGFMYIYTSGDVNDADSCVFGRDPNSAEYVIAPGETIYIVTSSYYDLRTGVYELEVTATVNPGLGEACDPAGASCAGGAECHGIDEVDSVCVAAPAVAGDACDVDFGCFDGAFCNVMAGDEVGTCEATVCGDTIVHPGEQCDDGNVDDGDGCSSTCQVEPVVIVDPSMINFTYEGALQDSDETWTRPSVGCFSGYTTTYVDTYVLQNTSAGEASVQVTVSNTGDFDTFLHAYSSADLTDLSSCVEGDDDFTGYTDSQIAITLLPGETLYFMVSSFYALETGPYTLTILGQ